MRKLLALALACTLALSSAVCVAAADLDLPDPIKVYDFETEDQYTVVDNGSGTVEVIEDMNAETGKGKGNVLKVPASGEIDTEVSLVNPFAGLDLSEGTQTADVRGDNYEADEIGMPIWYDGVVINYWIKTADDTNTVIVNFRNTNRLQFHKDDYRKHLLAVEAKAAYDKSVADGTPIDSRFALGETSIYLDGEGKEYTVYNGGGTYMTYNPEYTEGYKLGTGTIDAYKQGDDPEEEASWVVIGAIGTSRFEAFYEMDYTVNPKSEVRQGYTNGYLQFSLDGSIAFREDDLSGTNLNPNIVPAKPNEINCHNTLSMMGSETLTDTLSAENDIEKWHMVTIVIQNDWIDYYLDGELYEDLADEFNYWGTAMNINVAGKSFNAGFGLREPFQRGAAARTDYLSGNRAGSLLTEWLSLEDTTLSIGGTNTMALGSGGCVERVAEFAIDDVAFYDTLLDEDQIWALYEAGVEAIENPVKVMIGDVNDDKAIDAADALLVLKYAAKLDLSKDTFIEAAAATDSDAAINASDALNILKVAAKLIDTLPVE